MKRLHMIGSALSQLANVLTARDLTKTGPNESVSARMHRQGRRRRAAIIDAVFFLQRNPVHCKRAYLADVFDAKALLAEIETKGRVYDRND